MKYIDHGCYPVYVGLCLDEKDWHRELKRLDITPMPFPDADGRTNFFESPKSKNSIAIVTMRGHEGQDPITVAGVLVHEALHVWQEMQNRIGAKGRQEHETEAYMVQMLSQQLMWAYVEMTK